MNWHHSPRLPAALVSFAKKGPCACPRHDTAPSLSGFVSWFRSPRGSHLFRMNTDGILDLEFTTGVNGFVSPLAVQADGKILGGYLVTVSGLTRNAIGRLNADGTLDLGFYNLVAGGSDNPSLGTLALQADGK